MALTTIKGQEKQAVTPVNKGLQGNKGTLILVEIVNENNSKEVLPILPEQYVKGWNYNDYLTKTNLKSENNEDANK